MTVSPVQNINSKLTLDWNITPESIDESEAVSMHQSVSPLLILIENTVYGKISCYT